ncbi:tRNA (adenosine(37)-N6)-threonylcarbamoyltransferase complex dimerization subunit type 1 TsaB [Patescibacteria group bacterium]|nr:tRNA (adenosine(37)-N6)-threonylcarbamoyltransferase complex dimerization subunit type 1 TsaB [Patescibacteria group bacterium]
MILWINTADSKKIEVALKEDERVVDFLTDHNEFGSQSLLPLIEKILLKQGLNFKDLDEVKVNTGPGSFTGLKVGAAVAQALSYSLGIPVNGTADKALKISYT